MTLDEIKSERIKILRQYSAGEIDGKAAVKRLDWLREEKNTAARELARVRCKA